MFLFSGYMQYLISLKILIWNVLYPALSLFPLTYVFCCFDLYQIGDFPQMAGLPWVSIHIWEGGIREPVESSQCGLMVGQLGGWLDSFIGDPNCWYQWHSFFFFPGKCSLVLTLSFDSNPLPLPFTQSRISLFQCLQNWYSCFLHEWGRGHNKSLDCSGNDWVSWLSNYPLSRSLNNSHF